MIQPATGKRALFLIAILVSLVTSASAAQSQPATVFPPQAQLPVATSDAGSDAFARTDLFFGTDRTDLPPVSEQEWRRFLKSEITTRFPDGLTVLRADGQYMDSSGRMIEEKSFVVILLYPRRRWKESHHRIEQIRKIYTTEFKQQSVLRVDYPASLHVSF